jgi:hypothetical protein
VVTWNRVVLCSPDSVSLISRDNPQYRSATFISRQQVHVMVSYKENHAHYSVPAISYDLFLPNIRHLTPLPE